MFVSLHFKSDNMQLISLIIAVMAPVLASVCDVTPCEQQRPGGEEQLLDIAETPGKYTCHVIITYLNMHRRCS